MAIVINNTPVNYSSLNGDLIYTAYEATKANDPVTYPNYKYVCDVYVGGVMIFRGKAFPQPDNKRGVFNIASIVRSYIAFQFNPSGLGVLSQQFGSNEFYVDVVCKFGEEYNYTTYTNLTIDSSRRFYNHYNNQIYSTQTILGNYVDNIASNRPYYNSVSPNADRFYVPYFSVSGTLAISVTGYSGYVPAHILTVPDGFFISTTDGSLMTLAGSGPTTTSGSHTYAPTAGSLQILNLSPAALNADMPGLIDDTIDYYIVTINSTLTLLFKIVDECIYTPYTLHFLNQLGGFESVDFRKLSRKTYNIEKTSYTQQPFRMDGSGMIGYNTGGVVYETQTAYASQFTKKMKLSTDVLTDLDYKWLKELQMSPLVYLQDGNYMVPVVVTGSSYEERKFVNDRLTALQIDVEFGVNLNTQYR